MSTTPKRTFGLGLLFALLTGTLTVGHAIKAPCVSEDWSDGRPYRYLCYTDMVDLHTKEQLTGSRLPYLDPCDRSPGTACDEYPVLTMYAMRLAAFAAGGSTTRFFYANAILVWIAAFWIALLLYTMVGTRALYFALAPTLALYATNNWDLIAVAFATAGTFVFFRRRDLLSGILLGLGAAAKLYPALLVVPFVVGRFRSREPDRGIHLAWAAAGTWIAVNLPFSLFGTLGWWEFFRNSGARSASWNSVWFLLCERVTGEGCTNTRAINIVSAWLFVILVGIVWRMKAKREPGFPRWTLGFPILVLFLLTGKLYSPQFSLWLLPWFALALPNLRLFVAFELTDIAVFVTEFSWLGGVVGVEGGLTDLPLGALQLAQVARAIVLVLCVVAWVRRSGPVPTAIPVREVTPTTEVPVVP
jgi:uncharacterized membrane protein